LAKTAPKIPTIQICVAFVLGQKATKTCGQFFYLPGRKNGHPKTHNTNFCRFCFKGKSDRKTFKKKIMNLNLKEF